MTVNKYRRDKFLLR